MQNVELKVEGHILTIKVDLSKTFGPSKSGKTTIIGSTEGNAKVDAAVPGQVFVGLNVYKK